MNDGFGGGLWIFGLIVLLALFNGNFSGGNGNANAIQADVNRGFDNQNLQPQSTSNGTNPCVDTFVVAEQNANDCPCTIPTTAQIIDATAGTLTNVSVKVVKVK